ncbi:transcription elongation factor spt6 [Anaeramoeba ignava]|uniref:Transcription elongation factor spt6 n=1 Tax=Anaeramoeba ignava TaxID=1746090 RepID=A0A9Q0RDN2_ANAIG|nr:transcription elongation factor spt6 [Anaeramoeba ignava]
MRRRFIPVFEDEDDDDNKDDYYDENDENDENKENEKEKNEKENNEKENNKNKIEEFSDGEIDDIIQEDVLDTRFEKKQENIEDSTINSDDESDIEIDTIDNENFLSTDEDEDDDDDNKYHLENQKKDESYNSFIVDNYNENENENEKDKIKATQYSDDSEDFEDFDNSRYPELSQSTKNTILNVFKNRSQTNQSQNTQNETSKIHQKNSNFQEESHSKMTRKQYLESLFGEIEENEIPSNQNDNFDGEEINENENDDEDEYLRIQRNTLERLKREKERERETNIYDILKNRYTKTELEERFLTEKDEIILKKDIPERLQLEENEKLRNIRKFREEDYLKEAAWIQTYGFPERATSASLQKKILNILKLMDKEKLEIGFITMYRKEQYLYELKRYDLWILYKWKQKYEHLCLRKEFFKKMYEEVIEREEQEKEKEEKEEYDENENENERGRRFFTREEHDVFELLEESQSEQEIDDIYQYFQLNHEINKQKKQTTNINKSRYLIGIKRLRKLADVFGISSFKFGMNLIHGERVYTPHDSIREPEDIALDFLSREFPTRGEALRGARYILEQEIISDPNIRSSLRILFKKFARISTEPTEKGKKEIDTFHIYGNLKLIKEKPSKAFNDEQFLWIVKAEKEGFINIKIELPIKAISNNDLNENDEDEDENDEEDEDLELDLENNKENEENIRDDINNNNNDRNKNKNKNRNKNENENEKQRKYEEIQKPMEELYLSKEKTEITKKWNKQRRIIIRNVLKKLIPYFEQELKFILISETIELVKEKCGTKLEEMLLSGAFIPSNYPNKQENNIPKLFPEDSIEYPDLQEQEILRMNKKRNKMSYNENQNQNQNQNQNDGWNSINENENENENDGWNSTETQNNNNDGWNSINNNENENENDGWNSTENDKKTENKDLGWNSTENENKTENQDLGWNSTENDKKTENQDLGWNSTENENKTENQDLGWNSTENDKKTENKDLGWNSTEIDNKTENKDLGWNSTEIQNNSNDGWNSTENNNKTENQDLGWNSTEIQNNNNDGWNSTENDKKTENKDLGWNSTENDNKTENKDLGWNSTENENKDLGWNSTENDKKTENKDLGWNSTENDNKDLGWNSTETDNKTENKDLGWNSTENNNNDGWNSTENNNNNNNNNNELQEEIKNENDEKKDIYGKPFEKNKGFRIIGCSYLSNNLPLGLSLINEKGNYVDSIKLKYFLKRDQGINVREIDKQRKQKDILKLIKFIKECKPHVIVIGTNSLICRKIYDDILVLIKTKIKKDIQVTFIESDVAQIYSNSKKSEEEFPTKNVVIRHSISLARRLQNPILEISGLVYKTVNNAVYLPLHPLKHFIPKKELKQILIWKIVDVVSQVGIDIDKIQEQPQIANILPFIPGLGVRKSQYIIRQIANKKYINSRESFYETEIVSENVFRNCSGFIRFKNSSEPLDKTRIHPENYTLAKKICDECYDIAMKERETNRNDIGTIDDYEDEDENEENEDEMVVRRFGDDYDYEENYEENIERRKKTITNEEKEIRKKTRFIMDHPEILNKLDLETFAKKLVEENVWEVEKMETIKLIKNELSNPFADPRFKYQDLTPKELFYLLSGETEETLKEGCLVEATVFKIINEKGIYCRLTNGLTGFIHKRNLTIEKKEEDKEKDKDKEDNRRERRRKEDIELDKIIKVGEVLICKVMSIKEDRFLIELTSKKEEVESKENMMMGITEEYFDRNKEEKMIEEKLKVQEDKRIYQPRAIVHPYFKNITYQQAESFLKDKPRDSLIFRPSSKGINHLTLSWKFNDEIILHEDVIEEDKANPFVIGKVLIIRNQKYDDLDEIKAGFVETISSYVDDMLEFNSFKNIEDEEEIEKELKKEKENNPKRIPYFIVNSKKYGGKFEFCFLPNTTVKKVYISISPNGFQIFDKVFTELEELVKYFKRKYQESTQPKQTRKRNLKNETIPKGRNEEETQKYETQKRARENIRRDKENTRNESIGRYGNNIEIPEITGIGRQTIFTPQNSIIPSLRSQIPLQQLPPIHGAIPSIIPRQILTTPQPQLQLQLQSQLQLQQPQQQILIPKQQTLQTQNFARIPQNNIFLNNQQIDRRNQYNSNNTNNNNNNTNINNEWNNSQKQQIPRSRGFERKYTTDSSSTSHHHHHRHHHHNNQNQNQQQNSNTNTNSNSNSILNQQKQNQEFVRRGNFRGKPNPRYKQEISYQNSQRKYRDLDNPENNPNYQDFSRFSNYNN